MKRDALVEEVFFWLSAYLGTEDKKKAKEKILEMSAAMSSECRDILVQCFDNYRPQVVIYTEFSCNSSSGSRC